MAGFFCITRISGTSHKIGRNFSQDLPHLVTRYQASRFLASFYVLFCGHIPLPVENMPLPKNCSKNPSEVSASPQTPCSWAFRLKDWLLKFFSRVFILSAGIHQPVGLHPAELRVHQHIGGDSGILLGHTQFDEGLLGQLPQAGDRDLASVRTAHIFLY